MNSNKSQNVTMTIKLEYFRDMFRARLGADMISLRVLMSSINDKSFKKFQNQESKGMVFQSVLPTMNEGLIDYEIIKTFISMMRNVNDYLDRMIAIVNLSKKPIKIPHPMSLKEIQIYYHGILNEEMMKYCSKTKEEIKDKLKHFGNFNSEFIKYITTYNLLRNCYEHHKAITRKELQIPIKKMGLYTQDGKVVEMGKVIQGGSTISVKFTQKTINVKKGQPALLTYEDLVSTEMYLMLEVPVQIEKAVTDIIKNSNKSTPAAKMDHLGKHVFKKPLSESFNKVGIKGFIFPTHKLTKETEFALIETEEGHQTSIIEKECDFSYYVLSGQGYFLINEEKEECSEGDLIMIPAGTKFTYKGKLKMLLNVTPPFFPEQEETLDS